ncbi:hypothetical protein MPL3365_200145 [Mesorhizobium plurifarium]|uniref:Uncharacterized protein n=1 Tax=Mesorhizobium plurifarium TaxID=69974 RepID=A0A090G3F4_MESPL|nr:hypothetical protein MPL3365_200145 [Mesorhizobium plurifarium]
MELPGICFNVGTNAPNHPTSVGNFDASKSENSAMRVNQELIENRVGYRPACLKARAAPNPPARQAANSGSRRAQVGDVLADSGLQISLFDDATLEHRQHSHR